MFKNVEIPYGGYWSTPFAKWQGAFGGLHSVRFAAEVAKRELKQRDIDASVFDHAVLGTTIPQWRSFYGAPWFMGMIGAGKVPGPTVTQACQTGPRCLIAAAQEIEDDQAQVSLVATCDRTSNGPFIHYPGDGGPGGQPAVESYLSDSFASSPDFGHSMLQTAENVATRWQISTSEQHDVVLQRYAQYGDATKNDFAFQRRYMTLPFDIPDRKFQRSTGSIAGDAGIAETNRAAIDKLKPVLAEGSVTFAGQTHPADGNACVVVARADRARELSKDETVEIRILASAQWRTDAAFMPVAPVGAATRALDRANVKLSDIAAVKSHNPFVVNDIVFARETGYPIDKMNNFGCSLVYGHPQGPTGTRLVIELIEELFARGGGYGLYHGCAAGDSGFAIILEVRSRSGIKEHKAY